jgi:superfamily II DNA or RNA helicase
MELAQIDCGTVYARLTASVTVCGIAGDALKFPKPGAQYSTMFKEGRWDGNIRLGVRRGAQLLVFPAGLAVRLATVLREQHGVTVDVRDVVRQRGPQPYTDQLTGIVLKPFQDAAATAAVAAGRLCIKSPTSSGKTEIGAEIIRRLGLPTLWITHKKDLMSQTADRLSARLAHMEIGIVGSGKFLPRAVTVGMVQTLSKVTDPAWWRQWQVLMMDECHHSSSDTWIAVANNCSEATWRFGLSATPTAGVPLRDARLEGVTGPMYVATTMDELLYLGFIAKPRIVMLRPPVASYLTYEDVREAVLPDWRDDPLRLQKMGGQLYAHAYERGVTRNVSRNDLLAETVALHVRAGEKVLVLCTLLDHGQILTQRCAARCDPATRVWWLSGPETLEARKRALAEFRAQPRGAVLIASEIFKEGVDIPEIDVLVLAGGGAAEIATTQHVGRALRRRPDKSEVLIYDVMDGHSALAKKDYLANNTQDRLRVYRELGFAVEGA